MVPGDSCTCADGQCPTRLGFLVSAFFCEFSRPTFMCQFRERPSGLIAIGGRVVHRCRLDIYDSFGHLLGHICLIWTRPMNRKPSSRYEASLARAPSERLQMVGTEPSPKASKSSGIIFRRPDSWGSAPWHRFRSCGKEGVARPHELKRWACRK